MKFQVPPGSASAVVEAMVVAGHDAEVSQDRRALRGDLAAETVGDC